jgi:carboxymethylenebutenolidase
MSLHLSRRRLVQGLAAAAPLSVVLADARLARAAADSLEPVAITTASGREVRGVLGIPDRPKAPAVLLIHEWWGLNDQIKAMAAELAREGYLALACDLYAGKATDDRAEADRLVKAVDAAAATETLVAWTDWLAAHPQGSGKVASLGWCFGGGWALRTALARPLAAAVVYYGRVDVPANQLANLRGPVLGHFATRDQWIDKPMVETFVAAMAAAGKPVVLYWYDADHAFANPSGGRYDQEDAKLAWGRTLAFFREKLG